MAPTTLRYVDPFLDAGAARAYLARNYGHVLVFGGSEAQWQRVDSQIARLARAAGTTPAQVRADVVADYRAAQ